jgi:hypothetical protein
VARPGPGLDDDEHLLDRMTVTFRGSLAASWRGLGLASQRARLKAFRVWAAGADAVGFPVGKPEMTLGVTDRRVVVWLPTFWLGRPKVVAGSVPFDRLAQVEVYRSGLAVSLTFGFTNGEYVEVESMRMRHMRRVRDLVRERIGVR